jgi:D-alanine-D-alanine ligase-like ATP-grasp enzyme
MAAPFVVKPTNQGSSVGVRIVRINDNSWRE